MVSIKQKIVPSLWYDKEAKEAAEFYASIFPHSKVSNVSVLRDTPSGDCDIVSFELWGQKFMAISAGPLFKFNPSISFMVNFDPLFFKSSTQEMGAREKIDEVWEKLSEGGSALMPIGKYPFSERYGWVQDKYGLSWQLILTDPAGDPRPSITPSLLFVGKNFGKAEEAINHYLSIFKKNSKQGNLVRNMAGQEPNQEGTIMFADFMLENYWFAAMDGPGDHNFVFNEAISFMAPCDDQEEIDYLWENLSAVPEAEQCGWLKDKYGISWQIVPSEMEKMTQSGTKEQIARVTQAFLKMKKFDLNALHRAYDGA
jgi:predicted 3-demethylubiquinone-9 3-methyltransferase (glyoxalase superfamily)